MLCCSGPWQRAVDIWKAGLGTPECINLLRQVLPASRQLCRDAVNGRPMFLLMELDLASLEWLEETCSNCDDVALRHAAAHAL